jgi:DNA-binding SARP family transcriptional activator
VRIRVLGPFACSVNGSDLANTPGKGAAKTLALLRRLAAEGGFDGLPSSLLAEALWPGEGREGREKALESTLSRLRRLLGRADAVLLHEHRLRLNPRCVWLDSAVLESRLNTCTAQGNAEWSETLALWRGVPLVDEPDAPWLVDWRERQRMRLAAALQAAAAQTGHRARCLQAVAADPGLRQHL